MRASAPPSWTASPGRTSFSASRLSPRPSSAPLCCSWTRSAWAESRARSLREAARDTAETCRVWETKAPSLAGLRSLPTDVLAFCTRGTRGGKMSQSRLSVVPQRTAAVAGAESSASDMGVTATFDESVFLTERADMGSVQGPAQRGHAAAVARFGEEDAAQRCRDPILNRAWEFPPPPGPLRVLETHDLLDTLSGAADTGADSGRTRHNRL